MSATGSGGRIALATWAGYAHEPQDDDARLLAELPEARLVVWDDPAVDWESFDLVVVRTTWDYSRRLGEFLAWCERVGERLRNPVAMMRWNTDKRYMADLVAAGVPTVPTTFVAPGSEPPALPAGSWVVKPSVSAGARNTARHDAPQPAAAHVRELTRSGHVAVVQPYLSGVDAAGETGLLLYEGRYDHAIRKAPMLLDGASKARGEVAAAVEVEPREPSAAELEVADAAVAHVAERFGTVPLYARVDLLPTPSGPQVLELELTEPRLFLADAAGSAARFAAAIRRALAPPAEG